MPGTDKQRILDALFDEPGTEPRRPDKAYVKAQQLFFDSGIRPQVDELAPRRIWKKFQDNQAASARRAKAWRYAIPVAAAAFAVVAIGIIGWPNKPAGEIPGKTAKATTRRENFSGYYKKSVNLYVRQTENFSVSHHDSQFEIAADTLTARIDFTATRAIKTVRIQTPQVVFEIIGTKIALDVTADRAKLHVSEGTVRVSYANQVDVVEEGSVWEYSHGRATRSDEKESDEKIFSQLKSDFDKATPPPKPRPARQVRIQLNDGTELSGQLVRQTKDSVVILAPLAGNKEITLKRENIRSINNEGGGR